ncbi:MAG: MBOAT family O-acyltransferase [Acutalibacteraceae bacterium]
MVFSTTTFLFLFLPAVLAVYYIPFVKKRRKLSNFILTAASILFYAWGEPVFVLIMLGSIVINWAFGLAVQKNLEKNKSKAKLAVGLSVVTDLAILFVFKYLTFILENFNLLFNKNINTLNIALPIGISFFTFQAMSYVIDIYRGKGEAQKNPLNVALYISFFPQLIAGPIVRYETVADEIQNRRENIDDFCSGVYRFMLGLCKKVLIANNLATVADVAFGSSELSVAMAWLGVLAYTLQIYFDFSGYSEIAIGMGRMFGFHFLENFDYPYSSRTITEFWRRWHMSLGTWFRDYVYFPLGGSRVKSKARLVFNLFVVWSLTGIWHGANWTFLLWGLLYFVLLTIEKLTGLSKKPNWFGHIYTLFFVMLGWVLFRANNVTDAFRYIGVMFGVGSSGLYDSNFLMYISNFKFYIIAGVLASFPILKKIKSCKWVNIKIYHIISAICLTAMFIVSLSFMIKGSYNPFIYFNF